jgi:peroxiredoxin
VANIEKNIAMFNNVGCRVVVVSFGTAKGGEGWLNATGCKLDMFLDSDRNLYQAVGLHRSVVKVWNI